MTRLWTDEQEAVYRATPRTGGRWNGGDFAPADAEEPQAARRPSLLTAVLRAVRDIRER